jgi:hypothetical protein
VAAAVEDRDVLSAAQGLVDHVPAEEDGAAENEEAHNAQPSSCM